MDKNSVDFVQPEHFEFDINNLETARKIIAKYPEGKQRSAVLPLLDLAQRQAGGWLPKVAMDYIASLLELAPIRVYEVAHFYTMFNMQPVGKWLIQVCGTTPCWLRGAGEIMQACQSTLAVTEGGTTADKQFTLKEVECLGACVNAPIVQINDDFYEDLTPEKMVELIHSLRAGKEIKKGSQLGRQCSAPKEKALDQLIK